MSSNINNNEEDEEDEEYEKTFYVDLFTKQYFENNDASPQFIFIKNGDIIKSLPQGVGKLLELIFDKNLIDSNECNDKNSIFLSDIIKEYADDPNKILEYYLNLNTKIRKVPVADYYSTNENSSIQNYIKNCTHSDYKIEVLEVFRISRREEFVKYKEIKDKIENKKLLFYGAPLSHYASILSKGLEMTSNEAEPNFRDCEGIYFTDTIVEAVKFCKIDKKKQIGVVLLAEVAIGNTYKVIGNETATQLPNGKNSVKHCGKYQYRSDNYAKTITGVRVPNGSLYERNVNTAFPFNRYIVYNPNQFLFHYLVKFKCVPRK